MTTSREIMVIFECGGHSLNFPIQEIQLPSTSSPAYIKVRYVDKQGDIQETEWVEWTHVKAYNGSADAYGLQVPMQAVIELRPGYISAAIEEPFASVIRVQFGTVPQGRHVN